MFGFIKKKLQKIYETVTSKLHAIFSQKSINQETLHELERILITADTGVTTTKNIINTLQEQYRNGEIKEGKQLQQALEAQLLTILTNISPPAKNPHIFLLVGINGSGKTTFAGKLANFFTEQGKTCILAAADTFRAAAPQQLMQWAQQSSSELFLGKTNQDPASVAYGACQTFKEKQLDYLIIDTAGRMQTKEHLMKELEKIKRIIQKQLPDQHIHTLLTIDAMLGQNSFEQAKLFNESTDIDGLVLTKVDGTGKGGIIFSITQELQIPVEYISYGEKIEDMKSFDPQEYVSNILGSNPYSHDANH